MQGWICDERKISGSWLVNFPGYGENADVAEAPILEEDLILLPDGMSAKINERIKAEFNKSQQNK